MMDDWKGEDLYVVNDLVEQPKAALLVTHGLAEHLHRYDEWVARLNQAQISVFRFDLPGHGQSRKGRWLFGDIDVLTAALRSQFTIAQEYSRIQSVPLFLFGHSLGGLVTAGFVSEFKPRAQGVILSAPSMDPGDIVSPFLIRIAGWARHIVPNLPVIKLPPELISEDPEVVESYTSDPLVYHGKIPVQTGYEILIKMQEVRSRADDFGLPLLMLQGLEDQIIRPEMTRSYFEDIPVEDKVFYSYEEVYHETLHSLQKEKIEYDIMEWIKSRYSSTKDF